MAEVGFIAGISGVDGSLDLQTGLGSSITEISGTSTALGFLNVITFIVAPSDTISTVIGCCDSQPGAIGIVSSVVVTEGYLSITPDFNAITLIWRPENNILETLEWKTSILKAYDGTEQRIKIRQSPRQYFRLQLVLKTDKMNTWFDSMLHTWQKLTWLLPIWTEFVEHSSTITIKDDVIIVDTTNADFRDNSKAIVWKSETEYEVVVIDTKIDSQLNLSYSMLSTFTGNKHIIPVRTAYLVSSSRKDRANSPVAIVDLTFAIYDNTEITGFVPAANYDGYGILDTPAFMDNLHSEESNADIYITDFETGIFKVHSSSDFNFLSQSHKFFNDTKVACWNFRKFLHSLKGRQKTRLIPTFRDDVTQTDDINTLDITVNIENIGLANNMGFNSLRTYIGFYFPSIDTLIVRRITAITELDATEEQITFDKNLGLGLVVESGDCKICFVDKGRLASDRIQILWPNAHRNECQTNFMRIK